ncbi:MAG TPA: sulfurtransferase TusA family protein [Wenzhouxiangellaceae bacterium]|nr:sulfurtransferase TusA family protein [Wenzhouxiangellaceae bacterium]
MSPDESADRILDATGLSCPEPIFRARLALAEMKAGQLLQVSADDPLVEVDMAVFCQRTGHHMLSREQNDGGWIFLLRKSDA